MVAPEIPAPIRVTNNQTSGLSPRMGPRFPHWVTSANRKYEIVEPARPTSNTGRRPIRSDNRPHSGANRNCIAENEAMRQPRIAPRRQSRAASSATVPPRCLVSSDSVLSN